MFDFSRIEGLKETDWLEAKKATGGFPNSVWETYSAFANSKGGVLLLGVEEFADKSLHIVGLNNPEGIIKESLSITLRQAERIFANMKALGIIQRVGSNKTGYWEFNK